MCSLRYPEQSRSERLDTPQKSSSRSRASLFSIAGTNVAALALAACFVVYLTIRGTGDAFGLAVVWGSLALAAVSVAATARRASWERRRRALVGTLPTSLRHALAVRRAERWFQRRYLDAAAPRTFISLDEYREVCEAVTRLRDHERAGGRA